MSWLHRFNVNRTSRVVAVSSAVAFATQVAFALLMLRWFSPQEVGEFSVISQIGFFWMTLALAQTPLSLLANQHVPAHRAAQQAWRASVLRGLALLPIAALAVWFSQLTLWPALLWAMLLAFCQIGWMLAQSLTLRVATAWQQAAVRVLPPATATVTAALVGASIGWGGPTLLLSAMLGYAVGVAWLVPALLETTTENFTVENTTVSSHHSAYLSTAGHQSDKRSALLRMAHTLVDALLATALIVVWQRLYGAEETGRMSALLRVLGFVPAVVHMAWAQVALAQGEPTDARHANWLTPERLGLGAFACVIGLGLSCAFALNQEWLNARWGGVCIYIAPLVLWQGCACLSAAFSHRPFQTHSENQYSIYCILVATLQAITLFLPMMSSSFAQLAPNTHIFLFGLTSGLGLTCISIWLAKLR